MASRPTAGLGCRRCAWAARARGARAAGSGDAALAGRALDQPHAELLLEARDAARHRRFREALGAGGVGEAPPLDDAREQRKVVVVHVGASVATSCFIVAVLCTTPRARILGSPRSNAMKWNIDPSHSTAEFSVRHLMITNVKGRFGKLEGSVNYDPEKPEATTIEATIDAPSIDTRDEKRDAHLRSVDFFAVEKNPTEA